MVSVTSLWLPILLSAAFVFVASSIIHMLLNYHLNDFSKVPAEDALMDVLRPFNIPPGDYVIPCPGNRKAMSEPEFIEKLEKGPVAFVTILPNGKPSMGKSLALWFLYCVVVGVFAAYVTGRALGPGATSAAVFRFVGATAFAGFGLALLQRSIWYNQAWRATLKSVFDALVYAAVMAGTFGWLWPA